MGKPSVYKTKQREAILSYMRNNIGELVTVKQIDEYFRSLKTPIGIATIYRRLDELEALGNVSKYTIDGISGACFQYKNSVDEETERAHLMCEDCGVLTDLDCEFLNIVNSHILNEHRFNVNPQKIVFYGKCNDCMRNKTGGSN